MNLPTAREMMLALQRDSALRNDEEACEAFNRRARAEFEARIKSTYGEYDPDSITISPKKINNLQRTT